MEIDNNDLAKLLDDRLKQSLKSIVFLELNKDLNLNGRLSLDADVPMPIRQDALINGIKSGEYGDTIPFDKLLEGMIYVIGCDSEFKYNDCYIDILKKAHERIDSYIMARAIEFASNKDFYNSIIFFNALDKIWDNHRCTRYNIAKTLREQALYFKGMNKKDDYKLFYELSYEKFKQLTVDYPDLSEAWYHMGFYCLERGEYDEAVNKWKTAFSLATDEDIKGDIKKLMDGALAQKTFEEGKSKVMDGDCTEGLKMLIPLSLKYGDWSEAKYFVALGYRKLGNYKKAEVILNELLDSGEDFHEAYNELGLCYFYLGDMEKSIKNFKIAVKQEPDRPGYLCNLGIAYFHSGNIENAKKYIDRAYELDPDDELTISCRKWVG